MFRLLLVVVSLLAAKHAVNAFATGAGGCPRGMAAVGGTHLNSPATSFADNDWKIVLDYAKKTEIFVEPGGTVEVVDGEEYRVGVLSSWIGPYFKGALIRLDGDGELGAGLYSQVAAACTDAPGITHISNERTSLLEGKLTVNGDSVLDVTVVGYNNSTHGSVYSYAQVKLKAIVASEKPIGSPTSLIWDPIPPGAAPSSASSAPALIVAAAGTMAVAMWSML